MEGTRRAAEHRLLRAKNNSPTNRGIVHDQTSAMRAGSRDARSRCLEKFDGVQFQHPVILKNLRSLLYSGSLIICTSGMPVTSCSNADRDNGGSYVTSKLQTLDSPVSLVGCVLPNFMQSVQKPGGVLRSINTHSTDVPQRSQPNIKSDHCSPSRRVAESTPPNRVCLTECRILQSCSECTEEHIADFFFAFHFERVFEIVDDTRKRFDQRVLSKAILRNTCLSHAVRHTYNIRTCNYYICGPRLSNDATSNHLFAAKWAHENPNGFHASPKKPSSRTLPLCSGGYLNRDRLRTVRVWIASNSP